MWQGRPNGQGLRLPEDKKADLWHGRGKWCGLWPPSFPALVTNKMRNEFCLCSSFNWNLLIGAQIFQFLPGFIDTGLPTKDETMKTTWNSSNLSLQSLKYVCCLDCGFYLAKKNKFIVTGNHIWGNTQKSHPLWVTL